MKKAVLSDRWEGVRKLSAGVLMLAMLLLSSNANLAFSEEGAPADAATTTEATSSGDTSIVTGDAAADTTANNTVNSNDTSVTGTDSQGTPGDDVCDDLDLPEGCPEGASASDASAASTTPSAEIVNTNTADVSNTSTTTAETGTNSAGATGSGNASVDTGNAVAAGNVINVVNTNLVNSNGFIALLNLVFGAGNLDLRSALSFFDGNGNAASDCSLESCGSGQLKVVNNSDAEVVNDIVVRSQTGGNTASAEGGDASVSTGNAYAAANLINVVNSNFVNSNYLLLSINSFGGMNGDLVLPNADFFKNFFGAGSGTAGGTTVSNNNTADVTNNVDVQAETGNNTASSTDSGGASVTTGNSGAGTSVVNHVNTNLFGGSNFFLLVRVYGNWAGQIFSAPPGISWSEGPGGVQIFSDPSEGGGSGGSTLDVANTNRASVLNNVSVVALTGENKVASEGGAASVDTGDAFAAANVINVVNTNVIGKNWMFAILNIFGDWNGNIAFGRPDLWLGATAENASNADVGTEVPFTFTVTNNGDADATNVVLKPKSVPNLSFGGTNGWNIGTVKRGQTVEFTRAAKVTGSLPTGTTPVTLSITATGLENDANISDNTEEVTVSLTRIDRGWVGAVRPNIETIDPIWKVTKTTSASSTIPAGSSVTYTVVVQNDGGPGYDSVLRDTIYDANGEVVTVNGWNLGTVAPREEIRVTYTVAFGTAMKPGVYTNKAQVTARGRSSAPQYSVVANSGIATADVALGPPLPIVSAHKLELSNVRITSIGANRDTALVEWDTNVPATSKVVFGEVAGDYTYDVKVDPYFGYPQGTTQEEDKKTHHRVLLTGLEPGTAYKYRAVSFASPGVASDEFDFALELLSTPMPAATGAIAMADTNTSGYEKMTKSSPLAIEGWDGASNLDQEIVVPPTVSMVPTSSLMQLAAVIGIMNDGWLTAALLVLSLFFFLTLFNGRKKGIKN